MKSKTKKAIPYFIVLKILEGIIFLGFIFGFYWFGRLMMYLEIPAESMFEPSDFFFVWFFGLVSFVILGFILCVSFILLGLLIEVNWEWAKKLAKKKK